MSGNPLDTFISSLKTRMDALLALEPNLASPEGSPELMAFRSRSGISQLFYYAFHQRAIRHAVEYEALSDLYTQAILSNGQFKHELTTHEQALLKFFQYPATPPDIEPHLSIFTQNLYAKKKAECEKILEQTPSAELRSNIIQTFFIKLSKEIEEYLEKNVPLNEAGEFGLLLKHALDEKLGASSSTLASAPSAIHLKAPSHAEGPPLHLLKLNQSSGTKAFFETLEVEESPVSSLPEESYIIAARLLDDTTQAPEKVFAKAIHHEYSFGFFRLNIMSALQERCQQVFREFQQAKQEQQAHQRTIKRSLPSLKARANQYFSQWISRLEYYFSSCYQEKKPEPVPVQKGVIDQFATAFSDVVDELSTLKPGEKMESMFSAGVTVTFYPGYSLTLGGQKPPPAPTPEPPPLARRLTNEDLFILPQANASAAPQEPDNTNFQQPAEKKGWFW